MKHRKCILRGLSLIVALSTGLPGTVNAQSDNPDDPLAAILESLQGIEKQTSNTETIVSDPENGLPAIAQGLGETATAVDQLATELEISTDTLIQILNERLDELRDRIERLEGRLAGPATGAHRLWISPYWSDWTSGGGGGPFTSAKLFHAAVVRVVNPGSESASVSCVFFNARGNLLLDRGESFIVGRGGSHDCSSFPDELDVDNGWMLVASDQPVIPYGWYNRERNEKDLHREDMVFRPLDCDDSSGIDFACRFAKQ